MDEAVGCIALIFGSMVTWASYELYHQMRGYEFFSGPWFGYALASVAAALVGGAFIKAGAEA